MALHTHKKEAITHRSVVTSILLQTPLIMGCDSGATLLIQLVVTPFGRSDFSDRLSPHLFGIDETQKAHIRN